MFGKVLVANRGEIAIRVMRALEEMGIASVGVYSEIDRDALHVQRADEAYLLGPAPAPESYLSVERILDAAKRSGAEAIHPGYGFLAENPRLASRVRENGLTFVGPPPEVMELSGDKVRAREAARQAGVPVLPGREITTADEAHDIPYPLLLKAAGGGGGRGIKLAHDEGELHRLLSLARSEAGAAFGDDRIYVERFIAAARHVEVQIAADEHGAVVHLGERECSVQRRYQKVIEESPAPALGAPTRQALHAAAVAFAQAIDYRNLGTIEFIVDASTDAFFFLEINCRIQVEHPVSEAVTGRDLLALQLQIADGQPLGFSQSDISVSGHAIECRLNAEDVTQGFRPSPGTLTLFSIPERAGLRVDTHCRPGAVVPPYYDSLLAKLIGHAPDREAAIDILLGALEDVDIEGVETNRALLVSVLGHPDFAAAAVTTDWLERALA